MKLLQNRLKMQTEFSIFQYKDFHAMNTCETNAHHSFRLGRLDFPQVILENSDVMSKNAEQNYFLFSLTRWLCIGYISDCQCVFDFKQNVHKVSSFCILIYYSLRIS